MTSFLSSQRINHQITFSNNHDKLVDDGCLDKESLFLSDSQGFLSDSQGFLSDSQGYQSSSSSDLSLIETTSSHVTNQVIPPEINVTLDFDDDDNNTTRSDQNNRITSLSPLLMTDVHTLVSRVTECRDALLNHQHQWLDRLRNSSIHHIQAWTCELTNITSFFNLSSELLWNDLNLHQDVLELQTWVNIVNGMVKRIKKTHMDHFGIYQHVQSAYQQLVIQPLQLHLLNTHTLSSFSSILSLMDTLRINNDFEHEFNQLVECSTMDDPTFISLKSTLHHVLQQDQQNQQSATTNDIFTPFNIPSTQTMMTLKKQIEFVRLKVMSMVEQLESLEFELKYVVLKILMGYAKICMLRHHLHTLNHHDSKKHQDHSFSMVKLETMDMHTTPTTPIEQSNDSFLTSLKCIDHLLKDVQLIDHWHRQSMHLAHQLNEMTIENFSLKTENNELKKTMNTWKNNDDASLVGVDWCDCSSSLTLTPSSPSILSTISTPPASPSSLLPTISTPPPSLPSILSTISTAPLSLPSILTSSSSSSSDSLLMMENMKQQSMMIEGLTTTVNECEQQSNHDRLKIESLESSLQAKEQQYQNMMQDNKKLIDRLQEACMDSQTQITQHQSDLADIQQSHKSCLSEKQHLIDQLNQQIINHRREYEAQQSEMSQIKEQHESLTEQLSSLKTAHESLRIYSDSLKRRMDHYNKFQQKWSSQDETHQQALEKLKHEVNQTQLNCEAWKNQYNQVHGQYLVIHTEVGVLRRQRDSQSELMANLRRKLAVLEQKLETSEVQYTHQQRKWIEKEQSSQQSNIQVQQHIYKLGYHALKLKNVIDLNNNLLHVERRLDLYITNELQHVDCKQEALEQKQGLVDHIEQQYIHMKQSFTKFALNHDDNMPTIVTHTLATSSIKHNDDAWDSLMQQWQSHRHECKDQLENITKCIELLKSDHSQRQTCANNIRKNNSQCHQWIANKEQYQAQSIVLDLPTLTQYLEKSSTLLKTHQQLHNQFKKTTLIMDPLMEQVEKFKISLSNQYHQLDTLLIKIQQTWSSCQHKMMDTIMDRCKQLKHDDHDESMNTSKYVYDVNAPVMNQISVIHTSAVSSSSSPSPVTSLSVNNDIILLSTTINEPNVDISPSDPLDDQNLCIPIESSCIPDGLNSCVDTEAYSSLNNSSNPTLLSTTSNSTYNDIAMPEVQKKKRKYEQCAHDKDGETSLEATYSRPKRHCHVPQRFHDFLTPYSK